MQPSDPLFVFFGTPTVASDTLAYLASHDLVPSLIVSSPDAPRGRGLTLTPSPVSTWARENDLDLFTPVKIAPEVVSAISEYHAEYAIVVAYGKILPQSLIDAFPKGILNIHYSLLPKYRGASPVEAALRNGDTVTGVTIQRMVKELDAGDILATQEVAISPTETILELRPRLIQIGAELLVKTLPQFLDGTATFTPQTPSEVTTCGKITKEEGELDLSGDALSNWNKYRAYAESPGTYFFTEKNGKRLRIKIKTAEYTNGIFTPLRVVPEGKKETNYADFIR